MLVERFESRTTLLTILVLFVTLLLSACTDYYPLYVEEYGYGKSNKGVEFDGSKVKDLRNGRSYDVAKVGDVYWMMDNLAYEFYVEGDGDGKTNCPRQYIETCEEYGFLYSGERLEYACPKGWRLPSAEEWKEYYNSSAYQSRTYKKDTYMGYYGGDGSLNDDGNAAYFWTNGEADNSGYRKCVTVTPESDSFTQDRTCNKQWKLSVRCVLDEADAKVTSSSSEQNGEGKNHDCSVSDGVMVVYPHGGETFKVGDTITVIYGSDVQGSGYRFLFKKTDDDSGTDMLEESAGPEAPDGKTCYEQKVVLDKKIVGNADNGIIFVSSYEKPKKGANSGKFKISGNSSSGSEDNEETGKLEDSRDGHVYNTMSVNGKAWMTENLRYLTSPSYCISLDMDNLGDCEDGWLYTWDVAMQACPDGWHLPSIEEWKSFFIAEAGREQAEWMRENSIYGNACTLTGNNASAANISVSVKPSAYQDTERCKSSSNYKDCGEFFVKVENNDAIGYTDLELHFYIALPGNEVSEMPESYIAHVSSPSGEVPSNPQIAFGQYTEDNTGRPYLPIFINGMLPPSGGKIIFQLLWHNTTFNRLQGGWSLVEHAGDEYVSQFDGIDLTVAPQSTGNELDDTYYTVDPYIPVYMYEQLVSGFPPDGSEVGQSATRSCVRVSDSYGLYYWTSDEVDSEEAYHLYVSGDSGIEDEYPLSSKADAAMLVRCVQD